MIQGYAELWWVYLFVIIVIVAVCDALGVSTGMGISIGLLGSVMLWTHLFIRGRKKK